MTQFSPWVGFAFGSENLIQGLNCVKNSINSYTIDQLAILAGVAAVEDGDYFAQRCAQVAATRDRTSETLRELGFTHFFYFRARKPVAVKL